VNRARSLADACVAVWLASPASGKPWLPRKETVTHLDVPHVTVLSANCAPTRLPVSSREDVEQQVFWSPLRSGQKSRERPEGEIVPDSLSGEANRADTRSRESARENTWIFRSTLENFRYREAVRPNRAELSTKLCCRSLVFRPPPPGHPLPPSLLLPLPPPLSSASAPPSTRGVRSVPVPRRVPVPVLPLRRSRAPMSAFAAGATERRERTRRRPVEANTKGGDEINRVQERSLESPSLLQRASRVL